MRIIVTSSAMSRDKTAIASALTRRDGAQIEGKWVHAADLAHGTQVDQVNHFGQFLSVKGEYAKVEVVEGRSAVVRIVEIRAMAVDQMTDADFNALGYADRAAYDADWGQVYGAKIWYMKIAKPWWGGLIKWIA